VSTAPQSPITVMSARPDGATTIAAGIAAVLSRTGRTLLIDLNLDRPELAALLDVDEAPNLFHLAYRSKLGPASTDELEDHLQWRDGIGVLPGIARSDDAVEVSEPFIDGLVATAVRSFEHIVIDTGRPRPALPASLADGTLLWAMTPSPLGLAALDRTVRGLEEAQCAWLARARVIVNRESANSLAGVERFLEREQRLGTAGRVPLAPDYWGAVELTHSIRALTVPMPAADRYAKAYGDSAFAVRRAIEALIDSLAGPQRVESQPEAVGV